MKRVMMFGTFDLLHPGHHFVLDEAEKRGQVFVVIARDSNVKRIKKKDPIHTEEERKAAVSSYLPKAVVILGSDDNFLDPIHRVQPDLIVLGYDQKLPPGIAEEDLPCPMERLEAFHPEKYKSSLMRKELEQKKSDE